MAAGETDARGSADAPHVHASPPPLHNPAMLSPRAAAFSVEALLTGQEETEETGASPAVEAKTTEEAVAERVPEVTNDPQSMVEGAMCSASRRVDSPCCDDGSGRDASPRAIDENSDDEDLLVDVEDCSCESLFNEGRKDGGRNLCFINYINPNGIMI